MVDKNKDVLLAKMLVCPRTEETGWIRKYPYTDVPLELLRASLNLFTTMYLECEELVDISGSRKFCMLSSWTLNEENLGNLISPHGSCVSTTTNHTCPMSFSCSSTLVAETAFMLLIIHLMVLLQYKLPATH